VEAFLQELVRMKKVLASLFLLLAIGCSQPAAETQPVGSPTPPSTAESSSEPAPAQPASPPRPESNLTLGEPKSAVLTNPIVVSGTARTFENHVTIEIADDRGRVVTRTFATATGELGHHNPFRTEIFLTSTPGKKVTVRLLDHSAEDGSVREKVEREVAFDVASRKLTLYFPTKMSRGDEPCDRASPFERSLPTSRSVLRLAAEALVAGPTSEETARGATQLFPEGSRVEAVNLRDGKAVVDFNERLVNVGGACRAQAIRAAVEKTLLAVEGVRSVEIRAGGSAAQALQP
jgi:hypothetical protein